MKRQEIGGAGEQKTPNKKQTPKNPTKTQTTKIEKEWKEKKKIDQTFISLGMIQHLSIQN